MVRFSDFAPAVGFEPTTYWLTASRATVALRRKYCAPSPCLSPKGEREFREEITVGIDDVSGNRGPVLPRKGWKALSSGEV